MTIEAMLEELNESDVVSGLHNLTDTIDCIETVETAEDFRANLKAAISEAHALLTALHGLQEATK